MVKSSRRDFDAFRQGVLDRDGTTCQLCGADVTLKLASVQHRIPRGAGGSARVNRVSNGILVCGSATTPHSCHNWMEHEDRQGAEDLGYILPKLNSDIDPTQEPILTHEWGWVLLSDEGGRTPCAPKEAAG